MRRAGQGSSPQLEALLDLEADDWQPQVLEVNPGQQQVVPNIFKTGSVLNAPEHIEGNSVSEEAPHLEEASQVVVGIILIVAREREHVVVLVDPSRVRLEALRVRIVVPVSILTVGFAQAFQENHER